MGMHGVVPVLPLIMSVVRFGVASTGLMASLLSPSGLMACIDNRFLALRLHGTANDSVLSGGSGRTGGVYARAGGL